MKKPVKNIENAVISVQKLTQIHSTGVENIRQISFFMQNKPNFPHFSTENKDFTKKQTQFKAKQSQFWPKNQGGKAKQTQFKATSNPILNPRCELTCFPVGGKPSLTYPAVYRKFTIKKLSNYKQTFNIHPFLIDNSIVYALYGHICSFISRKWRRYFNAN